MIDIYITGQEGITRTLMGMAEGFKDLALQTQAALEYLASSVLENIAIQGRPSYPDILPESRASRREDQGTPPLWDTGELAAVATATREGTPNSQYFLAPDGSAGQIGPDPLFHGARRHQMGFGTDRLGRTFDEPARAFMVMQAADGPKVIEIYDRYIGALIASRGK